MLSLNGPDIALTTSTRERPLYMSGVTVVWGGGTVLGPLVGGAFAESPATWRWVSTSNIPSTQTTRLSTFYSVCRTSLTHF